MINPHRTINILLLCIYFIFLDLGAYATSDITCYPKQDIKNFFPIDYKAANQNWSITQDKNGILFFGNSFGLLEFTGNEWRLHRNSEKIIIRSVYADTDGRIYSGTFEDFGYWQFDSVGDLHYYSLRSLLENYDPLVNNSIWKILRVGKYLFFQTFDNLFIYDGKQIQIIDPDPMVYSFFVYKEKPYVCILNHGLFSVSDSLELIKESSPSFVSNLRIKNILPYSGDTSLVITEFNGLYLKNGNSWTKWECPANDYLNNYQISKTIRLNNHNYAIGTISNGVIVINNNGEILMQLNKNNGLQNNTVLAFWKDLNGNLWIGLDKGIDFAKINSRNTYFIDKTGVLGAVYCASLYKNILYIGTNHGLYYTNLKEKDFSESLIFHPMPGLKGQVWCLNIIDDQLICGFNTGAFKIEGGEAYRLSEMGGKKFIRSPKWNNKMFHGSYNGINVFEKNKDGKWIYSHRLNKIRECINYLQFDYEGNLWASPNKGLLKIIFSENGDSVINVNHYGKENGFESDYDIRTFKFENNVIFANGNHFYAFDYLKKKIIPFDWLNKQLGKYSRATNIYRSGLHEYCFINNTGIGFFTYRHDSLFLNHEFSYNDLHLPAINNYENIWKLKNYYLIGVIDGFVVHNQEDAINKVTLSLPKIMINHVECFNEKGTSRRLSVSDQTKVEIPYQFNNLYFKFTVPGVIPESVNYFYKFQDQGSWINIGKDHSMRYNHLRSGEHTIKIKAVYNEPSKYSIISYHFRILSPWYFHPVAIIFYFLLALVLLIIIRKINHVHLEREKLTYLNKIRQENEEYILRMKQKHLQESLKSKSQELANSILHMNKMNKVLNQINDILNQEKNITENSYKILKYKVSRLINKQLRKQDVWEEFMDNFNVAYTNFTLKLLDRHPSLTPKELRFCSLLRMNMTSKEIASILNISIRSIEVKRYRLRKKLRLPHEKNLVKYLMKI